MLERDGERRGGTLRDGKKGDAQIKGTGSNHSRPRGGGM